MKAGRLRRAWRSPLWYRPAGALGILLVGVSLFIFAQTSAQYREDRVEAFAVQQREMEFLREELQCRARESSPATRAEGEITREGWLAMTIWARTGDSDHPRIAQAADRVARLYVDLGPQLAAREDSARNCAPGGSATGAPPSNSGGE